MRGALALALLLVGGSVVTPASAGALYRGYCYATPADAALAWCAEAAVPTVHLSGSATRAQISTTEGRVDVQLLRAISQSTCTSFVTSGSSANFTLTTSPTQSNFSLQSSTTGTAVFPSVLTSSLAPAWSRSVSVSLPFPTCETGAWVSATAADGLTVGAAAGLPILLAAALLFMFKPFRGVS